MLVHVGLLMRLIDDLSRFLEVRIVAGTDRIGGHRDVAHREDVDALAAIAQLRPEDGDDTPPVGYKLSVFLAQPIELPKQPWGFLGGLAILFPGLERIIRRQ